MQKSRNNLLSQCHGFYGRFRRGRCFGPRNRNRCGLASQLHFGVLFFQLPCRLYGAGPRRIDGHHHMHLCANVQFNRLLPAGTLVRRNFSFGRGEKSLLNRLYRQALDRRLAKRHQIVDFLFPLAPLEPRTRLESIRCLAQDFVVEVETHPVNADEYSFLTQGEASRWAGEVPIASQFARPNVDGRKL